jgi:putative cardiolipin synthase
MIKLIKWSLFLQLKTSIKVLGGKMLQALQRKDCVMMCVSDKRQKRGSSSLIFIFLIIAITVCGFLSGCATLPRDYPRVISTAHDRPVETALERDLDRLATPYAGKSGFYIIDSGLEAFEARAALIKKAGKTLDLQYYIVNADVTGKILMDLLLKAADRGVRVRLLIDDLYTKGKDRELASLCVHRNIQIRVFNPFAGRSFFTRAFDYLTDFSRIQRRMHNKLFVADTAVGILGGRNLGDEYFDANDEVNFEDMDLLAIGPVVKELGEVFDTYWNNDLAVPVEAFLFSPPTKKELEEVSELLATHREEQKESEYMKELRDSEFVENLISDDSLFVWAHARLIYDPPEKISDPRPRPSDISVWAGLSPYMKETKSELILVSPYFVPGPKGIAALKALRDKGVRVRVLTNSLASNDAPVVHGGYARYREEMLRMGIELYEVRVTMSIKKGINGRKKFGSAGASLHAKTFIFDRKAIFIGSANLDPRSRYLNTELGLVVESPELAEQVALQFETVTNPGDSFRLELPGVPASDRSQSKPVSKIVWIGYNSEPLSGFWRRIFTKFLSFFAPESML